MPHSRLPSSHRENARRFRRELAPAERILWKALRSRQFDRFKFRRQHPFGSFILDFFCIERMLAVELDGGGHAQDAASAYDPERSLRLTSHGVRVLRFWNADVRQNLEGVLQTIAVALTGFPSPGPTVVGPASPARRGESGEGPSSAPSPAPRPLPRGEAR